MALAQASSTASWRACAARSGRPASSVQQATRRRTRASWLVRLGMVMRGAQRAMGAGLGGARGVGARGAGVEPLDGGLLRLDDVEEEGEAEEVEHVEDAGLEGRDLDVAALLADGLDEGHEHAEAGRGDVLEVAAGDDEAGVAL